MHAVSTVQLKVTGISSSEATAFRSGHGDANGQAPLPYVADGPAPCRHCLQLIADGDRKLVLSYRPFATMQPYAETGPIFLHGDACARYQSEALPAWFDFLDPAIIRGYGDNDWIRYDTGSVVAGPDLTAACRAILADPSIAYVHIRSKFNCFQCRIDRG